MECHYNILELPKTAPPEDIKKSYRKLVLQWHPDKNLENPDECKKRFQLIQQAYEVLSDPQERAWYDKHREEILKGGVNNNYKDDCVDVFQYFNAGCYSGYNDSEKGFYTVYRDVFAKIAEEDKSFLDEEEEIENIMPTFGSSTDTYDDIVHPFYAYWQSYCTAKSYIWIAKYDIQEAPNRKVVRLMEKENKKLRDLARRKRNEEIRELVAFVRKRDKRALAHKKELEEKAAENAKRVQEHRKKMLQERKETIANSKDTEWMSMADLEVSLKVIESQLEHKKSEDESEDDETGEEESMYCIACDKLFRSEKAKLNHDNSKKHLENLAYLKAVLREEEEDLDGDEKDECFGGKIEDNSLNETSSETDEEEILQAASKKKKRKKRKNKLLVLENVVINLEEEEELQKEADLNTNQGEINDCENSALKLEKKKKARRKDKSQAVQLQPQVDTKETLAEERISNEARNLCVTCNKEYSTRNKLFTHLKTTGHQVYVKNLNSDDFMDEKQKNKVKRKANKRQT